MADSYIRVREEALARPWLQAGKRWCWRAMWEQVHTSRARSGAHLPITHFTHRDGPAPLGSASGTQVRSVKMDACSPGEVGAISCPVAGRARKGAGLMAPTRSTVRSPSLGCGPGTAREALGQRNGPGPRIAPSGWACE